MSQACIAPLLGRRYEHEDEHIWQGWEFYMGWEEVSFLFKPALKNKLQKQKWLWHSCNIVYPPKKFQKRRFFQYFAFWPRLMPGPPLENTNLVTFKNYYLYYIIIIIMTVILSSLLLSTNAAKYLNCRKNTIPKFCSKNFP